MSSNDRPYETHDVYGNTRDAVNWVNANHPEWDIVGLLPYEQSNSVSMCTYTRIVYKVSDRPPLPPKPEAPKVPEPDFGPWVYLLIVLPLLFFLYVLWRMVHA